MTTKLNWRAVPKAGTRIALVASDFDRTEVGIDIWDAPRRFMLRLSVHAPLDTPVDPTWKAETWDAAQAVGERTLIAKLRGLLASLGCDLAAENAELRARLEQQEERHVEELRMRERAEDETRERVA